MEMGREIDNLIKGDILIERDIIAKIGITIPSASAEKPILGKSVLQRVRTTIRL